MKPTIRYDQGFWVVECLIKLRPPNRLAALFHSWGEAFDWLLNSDKHGYVKR